MKTISTILATIALAGATIGTATAHERHHVRIYRAAPMANEAYRDAYVERARNAYAWSDREDAAYWASHLEGGAISAPAGH